MSPPLALCTLDRSPLFGCPEQLADLADAAAEAGFTQLSVDIFSLRALVAAGGTPERLGARLAAAGLGVLDLSGITIGADPDAARAETSEGIELAGALGATWVQTRMVDADARALDNYADCVSALASAGLGAALEFSPFTPVGSPAHAARVIEQVGLPSARQGMVLDTWHLHHGDLDGEAALGEVEPVSLAYVQLADAAPRGPDLRHDTMHRRRPPGEGHLDLVGTMARLAQTGWSGPVAVEVLWVEGRRAELRDYAHRLWQASSSVLASAGWPAGPASHHR